MPMFVSSLSGFVSGMKWISGVSYKHIRELNWLKVNFKIYDLFLVKSRCNYLIEVAYQTNHRTRNNLNFKCYFRKSNRKTEKLSIMLHEFHYV